MPLERDARGVYRLSGDVTLYTVAELARQPVQIDDELIIDLSGIDKADSGVLALLIDWYRQALARGAAFRIRAIPPDLKALMRLYDLDAVLGDALVH